MYQIDVATAAPALPAATPAGAAGFFTDGDLIAGTPPTIVPAEFFNMLMLEVLGVLVAAGIAPSKASRNQLQLAVATLIQARGGNYALDDGAANVYHVVYTPAVTAPADGTVLTFQALTANNGASTFAANGVAARPIVGGAHQALQGGEIVAGGKVEVMYHAGLDAWVLLGCTGGAQQIGAASKSSHAVRLAQLSALAFQGFGQGLKDDGTGNATIKLADNTLVVSAAGLRTNLVNPYDVSFQLGHVQ